MESRSKEKIIPLELYTDGSSKKIGEKRFGGWAFVAIEENKKITSSMGSQVDATNQQMELEAVRQALLYSSKIRTPEQRVIIYSDSAYIINCYQQHWYESWRANNWQTSTHKPVANIEYWIDIIPFFENFWYYFKKVEGHAGIFWNEKCDQLAQIQANDLKIKWRGTMNE